MRTGTAFNYDNCHYWTQATVFRLWHAFFLIYGQPVSRYYKSHFEDEEISNKEDSVVWPEAHKF